MTAQSHKVSQNSSRSRNPKVGRARRAPTRIVYKSVIVSSGNLDYISKDVC